jgi:hypothetical protein
MTNCLEVFPLIRFLLPPPLIIREPLLLRFCTGAQVLQGRSLRR